MKLPDLIKNYQQIKDNPGKIFGFVYLYILIIGMVFGMYYVNNISTVARQSVPPSLPDTTKQEELQVTEAKTIPPVDLSKVEKPDQQMLDNGKNLYATACASCHGENGNGDGSAGASLNPKPRNFRSNEGWKNGNSLTGIYKTLEEGIPGSGMISYNYLAPEERIGVIHYLRNNFVPNIQPVLKDEVITLDQTYNLSAGRKTSAQIPVGEAMNLYLAENRARTDRIISSMREISDTGSEAGKIFSRVVSDRGKAVNSLMLNKDWLNDENKLKSLMTTGANRNGFNSEVYYLNENEWSTLHEYLSRLF